MKKTIKVIEILNWTNEQLSRTDKYADVRFKLGISRMIEQILHETENYKGFGFINNDDSETGTLGYYSRFYYKNYKLWKF